MSKVTHIEVQSKSLIPDFDRFPNTAYLRPKACAQLMGISIATFWRLVASGKLKTYKLTERTTTVRAGDLRAFIANRVS